MALELGRTEEKDHEERRQPSNGRPEQKTKEEKEADEDEDEDEEEDEPRLKYTSLTKNLRLLYRNGDATSSFLVAGDKMVRFIATVAGASSTNAEAV